MDKKYTYMLRYTIAPDCCEDERIAELIDFCKGAEIDDLMFFVNCEEINTGHITPEEQERWLELAEKTRKQTDELGMTFSINPWTTIMHAARGRTLRPGQNFRTMVDLDGTPCKLTGCPTDPAFIEYLTGVYARYAQVHPDTLWLEDDMRLHNHGALKWGGCFCDECMKMYSEIAGRPLTREELVAEAFAEGKPRPLRKVWLAGARKTIVNLCTQVADAVFSVDRNVRLGLMCSYPSTYCTEGRDWAAITKALTGNRPPVFRPHLPSYYETKAKDYIESFDRISMQTAAFLADGTRFAPELENFPYSRYTNSTAFTAFEIETACLFKADGIAMNIFDMMGSGVFNGTKYRDMLKRIKPFLKEASSTIPGVHHQKGVKALVSPNASESIYAAGGNTPAALTPREAEGAVYMGGLSVAWRYETDPKPESGVTFAAGQFFRGLAKDQVADLLSKGKWILDGDALLTLLDMGMGHIIGISSAAPAKGLLCAYEETVAPDRYFGVQRVRMTGQVDAGVALKVIPDEKGTHRAYSKMYSPYAEELFDTVSVYNDRFFVLPYVDCPSAYGTHCNPVLAELIHGFVDGEASYISDAPLLRIYEYEKDGKRCFALVNPSTDAYEGCEIHISGAKDFANAKVFSTLNGENSGQECLQITSDNTLVYTPAIGHLETVLITI
ncbi:MAG: hypothetical protein IJB47_03255 [Oscillospiraceae bacterium]|nr:hypothetical protein [Oscillospiraceae bacterium]